MAIGCTDLRVVFGVSMLSAAMLVSACQREVATPMRVEVRTNQGDPVHEAQVKVGNRPLGLTDARGILETKAGLPQDSQVQIEISKSSDSYYFAPHVETVDLKKEKNRPVLVKAVLYFVPKPKPVEAETSTANAVTAAGEAIQADQAKTAEQVAEKSTETTPQSVPGTATDATTQKTPETAPVAQVQVAPEATPVVAPEVSPDKPAVSEKTLVTFHVFGGNTGLAGATVSAMPANGDAAESLLCKTNVRGRCAVKVEAGSQLVLKVERAGYVPETQELQVDSANKLVRVQMEKGQRLLVHAYVRGVLSTMPLQGVVVSVDGKPIGSTDKSGRLAWTFKASGAGRAAPLMKVELAPPEGYLPEVATSEFAPVAGIALVRHFGSLAPRPPLASIEDSRQGSSSLDPSDSARLSKASDASFDRNVFPRKILIKATKSQKNPDVRIRRSFSRKEDSILAEYVALDAKGVVIAAVKEGIEPDFISGSKTTELQKILDAMASRLIRSLPFQGVVTGAEKNQVRVLLPGQLAAIVKSGDRFDVFSTRYDPRARKQMISNVASVEVPAESMTSAGTGDGAGAELALALEGTPIGKGVARGDIVVLRGVPVETVVAASKPSRDDDEADSRRDSRDDAPLTTKTVPTQGGASILVRSKSADDPRAVPQANVYFNDVWVGTTNNNGVVYLPKQLSGVSGKFSVAKAGWTPVLVDAKVGGSRQLEVALEPEPSRLRVDSVPSGANVFLDGKLAGKTPLDTKMDGAGAFVKLEIAGPDGFKKHSSVLEIDAGTLDLTGQRAVQLENDVVASARKLSESGKAADAVAALAKVPPTHSDYLVSRHLAGEIALARLNDPEKAEQFFSSVTSAPEVRDFIDKRFVGSHINEGIALHMIAEKISRSNPKAAAENFGKAAAILDRAARYTRFLPKKDFKSSVQNLEYFRALSFHRRWLLVNDPMALENANRGWRDYVGTVSAADETDKQAKILADNARVYLKQTEAGLSRR